LGIHYDPREYYGANNLKFNEWGGVSKEKGLHIHSEKYPYEFHMLNSIDVMIDENAAFGNSKGNMPVEEYGLDDAIKEILDHYKNIEIKWN